MRLAVWSLGLVAACGGGDSSRCPGPPPAIADCFQGEFFAECGGGGGPALACSADDCRWFAGCVAAGYEPSPCPADDLCCEGGWPYPGDGHVDLLSPDLQAHGTAPWDRARDMRVQGGLDPSLGVTIPATTMCSGTFLADGTPCSDPPPDVSLAKGGTLVVRFANRVRGPAGWDLVVEAAQNEVTGAITARVCQQPYTDVIAAACPATEIECAAGGTLTLSRWPTDGDLSGLAGRLEVWFGANRELQIDAAF